MNFWQLIYCLFTGTNPTDLEDQKKSRNRRANQTNPMSHDPNIHTYRTRDGLSYFQFSYHKIGRSYEIDIHLMPPFNGRSKNAHTIHVLSSSRQAQHKICIHSGREPKTLDEAKEVSKVYAELINTYIKTGVTPDKQLSN